MAKYSDDVAYSHLVLDTIHRWPFMMKAITLQIY